MTPPVKKETVTLEPSEPKGLQAAPVSNATGSFIAQATIYCGAQTYRPGDEIPAGTVNEHDAVVWVERGWITEVV